MADGSAIPADRSHLFPVDEDAARRFPVDRVVEAVVRDVLRGDRTCSLELPGGNLVVAHWDDERPAAGDAWTVRVVRHGPAIRRVIVARA